MGTAVETERRERRRWPDWWAGRWGDLLAFGLVPVALVGVFALPVPVRRTLVFEYGRPSVVTAAVAPFVHLGWAHLLVNVTSFVAVAGTGYALAVVSGHRTRYIQVFVTFVVVFPPVLSYTNLAVPRQAYSYGFSGVVLAFVGYLPIGIATLLEDHFEVGPSERVAPGAFCLGLALVTVLSVRSVVPANRIVLVSAAGLSLAAVLSALLFMTGAHTRGVEPILARLANGAPLTTELLAVATILFVGMQFVAFPADPTQDGGVVNMYVHVMGYALGFLTVYGAGLVHESLGWTAESSRPLEQRPRDADLTRGDGRQSD